MYIIYISYKYEFWCFNLNELELKAFRAQTKKKNQVWEAILYWLDVLNETGKSLDLSELLSIFTYSYLFHRIWMFANIYWNFFFFHFRLNCHYANCSTPHPSFSCKFMTANGTMLAQATNENCRHILRNHRVHYFNTTTHYKCTLMRKHRREEKHIAVNYSVCRGKSRRKNTFKKQNNVARERTQSLSLRPQIASSLVTTRWAHECIKYLPHCGPWCSCLFGGFSTQTTKHEERSGVTPTNRNVFMTLSFCAAMAVLWETVCGSINYLLLFRVVLTLVTQRDAWLALGLAYFRHYNLREGPSVFMDCTAHVWANSSYWPVLKGTTRSFRCLQVSRSNKYWWMMATNKEQVKH